MKNAEFLCEKDDIVYCLYKPNIFRLYANCYTKEELPPYCSRLIHKIRMTRELLFAHYVVIYLRRGQKTIGHLVVSRGGTRIAMSRREDIVIGPIWIVPSERGKGVATRAIYQILHSLGFRYECAYEYIERDNEASVRTVEKNGFALIAQCSQFGPLKTIRESGGGQLLVYRYREKI